jgi:cyclophilin family peptidyl-prolyl cis-trans isomerase
LRRRLLIIALACAGALAVAAPCAAYTPPETNPRIVLDTTRGPILVALVPENSPRHVEQLLTAIAGGNLNNSQVARVSPQFYVQVVGALGQAQLSGQPVENHKVGNVRAAVSVYDGGEPGEAPTLMFVLTDSPQLDTDYSTVGFVEAGLSVVEGIAETPAVGDHQPEVPITITGVHVATEQERILLREAEKTAMASDGTAVLAAVFIIASTAFLAAIASSFHDRLNKQRIKSLALLMALFAFFAVWVALGGSEQGSGLVGVALFGGAIGMFRLMGKFERPAQTGDLGEQAKPPHLADGEPHPERRVDQSKGELEVVLGQGHAPARRSGHAAR